MNTTLKFGTEKVTEINLAMLAEFTATEQTEIVASAIEASDATDAEAASFYTLTETKSKAKFAKQVQEVGAEWNKRMDITREGVLIGTMLVKGLGNTSGNFYTVELSDGSTGTGSSKQKALAAAEAI